MIPFSVRLTYEVEPLIFVDLVVHGEYQPEIAPILGEDDGADMEFTVLTITNRKNCPLPGRVQHRLKGEQMFLKAVGERLA